jgi:hypothetical protein
MIVLKVSFLFIIIFSLCLVKTTCGRLSAYHMNPPFIASVFTPKLEAIHVFIDRWTDNKIMDYSYTQQYKRMNYWYSKNTSEAQKSYAEKKKPEEKYIFVILFI